MFWRGRAERERTLLRVIEAQDRRIDTLVNQLLAVQGQPWLLPPRPEEVQPRRELDLEDELNLIVSPEQEPR